MRFLRKKGTVQLPVTPARVSIQKWAFEVMNTLRQLKNQGVDIPKTGRGAGAASFHFKVSGAVYDSGAAKFTVTVRGGHFLIRSAASGGDCFEKVIPYIDVDGTLTPLPPEETATLELASGETLFLKVETDEMDLVKDADSPATGKKVEFTAGTASQISTHNQPIDDEDNDGTEGEYYYAIAKLIVDPEDSEKATIEQIQQGGPIIHTPPLWKGENVGGGAEVFKGRDTANNTYQLRSTLGKYGVSAEKQGDEIVVNQDNSNVGLGKPIWVVPTDESGDEITDPADYPEGEAEFRTIKQRDTMPQVKVKLAETDGVLADEIVVEGNNYDNSIAGASNVSITVIDGLVTALAAAAGGDGEDLNIEFYVQEWVSVDADGTSAVDFINVPSGPAVIHYWRDGLYVGDSNPDDGSPPAGLKTVKTTYMQESS